MTKQKFMEEVNQIVGTFTLDENIGVLLFSFESKKMTINQLKKFYLLCWNNIPIIHLIETNKDNILSYSDFLKGEGNDNI